ncbi:hypothetical protein BaRGS_00020461 [Batillaria attramentaria]|uniref:Uncharacterized protein n=1 Tax=Batillaria attramentaria TaxID=370345 RepID=A0ABD0KMH4_9CAEN
MQTCPECGKACQLLWQHKCKGPQPASPWSKPCLTCGQVFQRLGQHKCKGPASTSNVGSNAPSPALRSAGSASSSSKRKPCPTCGVMFERLWQHKCKSATSAPNSVTRPASASNSVLKSTTVSSSSKRQPCPTCGDMFERLWQHKCKSATSHTVYRPASAYNSGSVSDGINKSAIYSTGQPCPTCGEVFQRLWQHKCKVALASSGGAAKSPASNHQPSQPSKPTSPPRKVPCPTCGVMFQRLWQHKCKAASASSGDAARSPTPKSQPSSTGKSATPPREEPCPTCGVMFQRLWQHKCKVATSASDITKPERAPSTVKSRSLPKSVYIPPREARPVYNPPNQPCRAYSEIYPPESSSAPSPTSQPCPTYDQVCPHEARPASAVCQTCQPCICESRRVTRSISGRTCSRCGRMFEQPDDRSAASSPTGVNRPPSCTSQDTSQGESTGLPGSSGTPTTGSADSPQTIIIVKGNVKQLNAAKTNRIKKIIKNTTNLPVDEQGYQDDPHTGEETLDRRQEDDEESRISPPPSYTSYYQDPQEGDPTTLWENWGAPDTRRVRPSQGSSETYHPAWDRGAQETVPKIHNAFGELSHGVSEAPDTPPPDESHGGSLYFPSDHEAHSTELKTPITQDRRNHTRSYGSRGFRGLHSRQTPPREGEPDRSSVEDPNYTRSRAAWGRYHDTQVKEPIPAEED